MKGIAGKALALFLSLTMLLSVSGCGGNAADVSETDFDAGPQILTDTGIVITPEIPEPETVTDAETKTDVESEEDETAEAPSQSQSSGSGATSSQKTAEGTSDGDFGKGGTSAAESGSSWFAGSSGAQKEALGVIENFHLRYYLCCLGDSDLENFTALYSAIEDFDDRCEFPNPTTFDKASKLIILAVYECPELMQISTSSGFSFLGTDENNITGIELSYCMSRSTYENKISSVRSKVSSIANGASGSDYEKELYAYNWITKNCAYSTTAADCSNPYGCLVGGAAKCDGISFAMKLVMEKMGIACVCVDGSGGSGSHVWNAVNIGNTWYDLDVTNDAGMGVRFYGAFNVGKNWIKGSYSGTATISRYVGSPSTSSMDGSYYSKLGMYIASGKSYDGLVSDMLTNAFANGGRTARVQFESQSDYSAFLDGIEGRVSAWMGDNGLSGTYVERHIKIFRTVTITIG